MTLQADQIRAALDHALATADLDATAPPSMGEATAAPAAHLRARQPVGFRRRPLAVAAAVLVVAGLALAVAVAASRPDRSVDPAAPREGGPAVAAALEAPGLVLLDWADPPVDPDDVPPRTVPAAHLRVLRSADGRVIAVADRVADGDGSLDRFSIEGPREVDGVEVRSAHNGDLGSLDVSGWVIDDQHIRVATRGLSPEEHDAAVGPFVAASLAGSLSRHVPEGFALEYDGPDENPFARVRLGTEADYVAGQGTADAERVSVLRLDAVVDAQELDRYAWFWTSARPTTIDGVPALIAAGQEGRATLYLARPDGMVIISAGADDVARYARSVVLLDAAGWAAHRATAQEPGSIHATAEATPRATAGTQPP